MILGLLLSSAVAFAQPETDKTLHAVTSSAITSITYSKLRDRKVHKSTSMICSVLLSAALGITKEYVIDDHPDPKDLMADGIGIVGTVLIIEF